MALARGLMDIVQYSDRGIWLRHLPNKPFSGRTKRWRQRRKWWQEMAQRKVGPKAFCRGALNHSRIREEDKRVKFDRSKDDIKCEASGRFVFWDM